MKNILFAILALASTTAFAENQIAALVNFEATAIRPDSNTDTGNVTSIVNTSMELTMPQNLSVYGGFSFILGEDFESAVSIGSRFYSSTPALEVIPGAPMWAYIGGGVSFFDEVVYYPEAGFRLAVSDSSRLDIYMKILNSGSDTYDQHFMIGAGLTF